MLQGQHPMGENTDLRPALASWLPHLVPARAYSRKMTDWTKCSTRTFRATSIRTSGMPSDRAASSSVESESIAQGLPSSRATSSATSARLGRQPS